MISEEVLFKGHANIQSLHSRTIEITKEKELTLRGDCIIGVNANKSCKDLSDKIKEKIKNNHSFIEIELIVEPFNFIIKGYGNNDLLLTNNKDIVLRKSKFICDRTLSINCDYSWLQISREIIELLKFSSKTSIMLIKIEYKLLK